MADLNAEDASNLDGSGGEPDDGSSMTSSAAATPLIDVPHAAERAQTTKTPSKPAATFSKPKVVAKAVPQHVPTNIELKEEEDDFAGQKRVGGNCSACRARHQSCNQKFPCIKCIARGIADQCKPQENKKRRKEESKSGGQAGQEEEEREEGSKGKVAVKKKESVVASEVEAKRAKTAMDGKVTPTTDGVKRKAEQLKKPAVAITKVEKKPTIAKPAAAPSKPETKKEAKAPALAKGSASAASKERVEEKKDATKKDSSAKKEAATAKKDTSPPKQATVPRTLPGRTSSPHLLLPPLTPRTSTASITPQARHRLVHTAACVPT